MWLMGELRMCFEDVKFLFDALDIMSVNFCSRCEPSVYFSDYVDLTMRPDFFCISWDKRYCCRIATEPSMHHCAILWR